MINLFTYCILVIRESAAKSHVIIGTPDGLIHWMTQLFIFDPKKITMCVLDGGDVLLDSQQSRDNTLTIKMYVFDNVLYLQDY